MSSLHVATRTGREVTVSSFMRSTSRLKPVGYRWIGKIAEGIKLATNLSAITFRTQVPHPSDCGSEVP